MQPSQILIILCTWIGLIKYADKSMWFSKKYHFNQLKQISIVKQTQFRAQPQKSQFLLKIAQISFLQRNRRQRRRELLSSHFSYEYQVPSFPQMTNIFLYFSDNCTLPDVASLNATNYVLDCRSIEEKCKNIGEDTIISVAPKLSLTCKSGYILKSNESAACVDNQWKTFPLCISTNLPHDPINYIIQSYG